MKLTAAEFAKAKAKESWAREWVYLPSGTFTLTLQGTEHTVSKGWTGAQDKLSALEDEIVATGCCYLKPSQSGVRSDWLRNGGGARKLSRLSGGAALHKVGGSSWIAP